MPKSLRVPRRTAAAGPRGSRPRKRSYASRAGAGLLAGVLVPVGFLVWWFFAATNIYAASEDLIVEEPIAKSPPQAWQQWRPRPDAQLVSSHYLVARHMGCSRGLVWKYEAGPDAPAEALKAWMPCSNGSDASSALQLLVNDISGVQVVEDKAPNGEALAFSYVGKVNTILGRAWQQGSAVYLLAQICHSEVEECSSDNVSQFEALSSTLPGEVGRQMPEFSDRNPPALLFTMWLLTVAPFRLVTVIRRDRFRSATHGPHLDVRSVVAGMRARRTAMAGCGWAGVTIAVGGFAIALISAAGMGEAGFAFGSAGVAAVVSGTFIALWLFLRGSRPRVVLERNLRPDPVGARGFIGLTAIYAAKVTVVPLLIICSVLVLVWLDNGSSMHSLNHSRVLAMSQDMLVRYLLVTSEIDYRVAGPTLFLLVIALPIVAMSSLERVGWWLTAPSADSVLAKDLRPPVLYLRSFDEDSVRLPSPWTRKTLLSRLSPWRTRRFEELLATAFHDYGPVIAVSPPGTTLAPLGSARITIETPPALLASPDDPSNHLDETWQHQVREWADQSALILICATPGEVRAGFDWELQLTRTLLPSHPIVLAVAPHRKAEVHRRFGLFLQMNWDWCWQLADSPNGILLACHRPGHGWRSFNATTRTDATYTAAIRICLEWLDADAKSQTSQAPQATQ